MKPVAVWSIAICSMLVGCGTRSPDAAGDQRAPQTRIEDIIAKNTAALGGEAALDRVQTMIKHSLIEEGDYRDIAIFATDRQGRMRVDIVADGKRVFAESYDGLRGHQWQPGKGQTAASEPGTIALSHTPQLPNHIFRLKDVVANGHQIELVDTEVIDGVNYHVLQLTLSDGFESFLYAEADSGLVTRVRNERALHVDIDDDEKVIETLISNFRRVGEIMHPHSVVEIDKSSGATLVRITLQRLEVNKKIPDEYFGDLIGHSPAD